MLWGTGASNSQHITLRHLQWGRVLRWVRCAGRHEAAQSQRCSGSGRLTRRAGKVREVAFRRSLLQLHCCSPPAATGGWEAPAVSCAACMRSCLLSPGRSCSTCSAMAAAGKGRRVGQEAVTSDAWQLHLYACKFAAPCVPLTPSTRPAKRRAAPGTGMVCLSTIARDTRTAS